MSEFLRRTALEIENRRLFSRGEKILVAVSGGADSMVLLHALHSLAPIYCWEISIAHFNHRLRGRASNADDKLVRQTAAKLRLKFFSGGGDVKKFSESSKISIEMAARKLRHGFLAQIAHENKIPTIALAHHADDQVELFFLRLLRGAGGEGLAGMKWKSPSPADKNICLARPLLGCAKNELLEFARENKIRFREDASNNSADFLRNKIRHELLPLLKKNYQPGLSKTVLRTMEIAGAEAEFVAGAAHEWRGSASAPDAIFRARAKNSGALKSFKPSLISARIVAGRGARPATPGAGVLPAFEKLPVAIQRKILQCQLIEAGLIGDFELVEQLRQSAEKFVSVSPGLSVARDLSGKIKLRREILATFDASESKLKLSGRAGRAAFGGISFYWSRKKCDGSRGRSPHQPQTEFFDADKVGGDIILRHWRAGDRFQPIGLKSAVKLQDLFVNAKIPAARRRSLILAATAAGGIFWVEGLRIGEQFKLTTATRRKFVWRWSAGFSPLQRTD